MTVGWRVVGANVGFVVGLWLFEGAALSNGRREGALVGAVGS